jgi:hypothetical protein
MGKTDRRRKLRGYELEAGEEIVTRDVNQTLKCTRCGGHLDLLTIPMTGQTVEACQHCGTNNPVARFRPVEDEAD